MDAEEDAAVTGLINSGFALSAVEQFLARLYLRTVELGDVGAGTLLDAMVPLLAEETPQSKVVLDTIGRILTFSPAFVLALSNRGPRYVRESFNLQYFLLHPNQTYNMTALETIVTMVSVCPSLVDWRRYVDDTDRRIQNLLVGPLTMVTPARQQKPTYESLGDRLQASLAAKFGPNRNRRRDEIRDRLCALFPGEDIGLEQPAAPSSQPPTAAAGPRRQAAASEEEATSVAEDEIAEQVAQLTVQTPLDVITHVNQMQDELVDNEERMVRSAIAVSVALRQKALKERNGHVEIVQARQIARSQHALVEVHLNRRKVKAKRLAERLRYADELAKSSATGLSQETLAAYRANGDLQARAIAVLERLYDALTSAIKFTDVSAELAFLDRQIGALYDVSFSFVVSGLISVGKSTFVNCVTGHNLSPNRVDTMTAIPTNYVHDPNAAEPVMVVPFADQLNRLLEAVRGLATAQGKDVIAGLLGKKHLAALLDRIVDSQLAFQVKYTGAPAILEHSTYIHDLFRLAVEPALATDLVPYLPLDWSQGLDTYLTVYARFPRADMITGLVNVSIVDTPGVNEFGVQKLNLRKTIQDALSVSCYGVLVATNDGLHSVGMKDLKGLFDSVKRECALPVAAVVTHCENVAEKDRAARREQTSTTLSVDLTHRCFAAADIHLVSAQWMLTGVQMLEYLDRHGRLPTVEQEAALVEGYVAGIGGAQSFEEKLQEFAEGDVESVRKQCQRRIKHSGMPETLDRLLDVAVRDGVEILVRNSAVKSRRRVQEFTARFQLEVDVEKLKKKEKTVQEHLELLQAQQRELTAALHQNLGRFQQLVVQQGEAILLEIEAAFQQGIPEKDPPVVETITQFLQNSMFKIPEDQIRQILSQTGPLQFQSKDLLLRARTVLPLRLRLAVQNYLWYKNNRMAQEILHWSAEKKAAIEKSLRKIAQLYAADFKIQIDPEAFKGLAYNDDDNSEVVLQFGYRSLVKKRRNLFDLLGLGPKNAPAVPSAFVVDPVEVRRSLLEYTHEMLPELLESVQRSAEIAVGEAVAQFVGSVSSEIKRVQTVAAEVHEMLVTKREEMLGPINETVAKTSAILAELDALVPQNAS